MTKLTPPKLTVRQTAQIPDAAWSPGTVLQRGKYSLRIEPRLVTVTAILLGIVLVLAVVAMAVGSMLIPFTDVLAILFGQQGVGPTGNIVTQIRLPRVLTAVFAGAALGISGGVFQSISRNVLGSPDIIGFTTGAATGALAQIIIFGGGPLETALSAIIGGVVTAIIVYLLSVKAGVTGGYRLILTGIGVSAVLAALNNLMLVKGNLENSIAANLWLAGSLNARNWYHALPVMIGVLVLLPLVIIGARRLNMMELGDDFAQQLGVSVEKTRLLMIAAAVILASLATGAAGPIAFIALAAPQLVKRLTRSQHIPVVSAAAMGALLMIFADVLTQLMPFSMTLPIGRMTGLLGGIYLIWLLTRAKQV